MAKKASSFKKDVRLYKRLLTYLLPVKWAFFMSFVGFGLYAAMDVLAVDILQYLIDSLGGETAAIGKIETGGIIANFLSDNFHISDPLTMAKTLIPVLMVLIAVFRGFGSFMGNFFMRYVGNSVVLKLRNELFEQLTQLPMAYINGKQSGKLVSRITYNVEQVTSAVTNALTTLFRDGLTVVCLFAYLVYVNYKLTLTFLVVIPLIGIIVSVVSKRFRLISHRLQNSMGDITQVVTEAVNSSQDMRVYGAQVSENGRFQKATQYNFRQRIKEAIADAALSPTVQILLTVAIALLVWIGLNSHSVSSLSPGSFVAYLVAAGAIAKPFRQVTSVLSTIQKALAAAEDIFTQLDEDIEVDNGTKTLSHVKGKLSFHNVHFTYPGAEKETLKGISFEAKPGEMVALVGSSGGGKSTLAGLIPRFYDATGGQIVLDDVPINELTLNNLRSHIALVSQNVVLFNDTVANNIAYGEMENYRFEDVERASRLAHAHDFILRLPQGYDTPIGDNGVLLSGGQRQRIAIARAILKDAPILIMDEATSALDNESEQLIQSALLDVMKDRTTLVIAHRLTTIQRADKILVVQAGEIVEKGTHVELVASEGHYAKLNQPSSPPY
ncbi:MAG: lipid A export permease/ATP-binding protein MsbA [Cellvibrionales bacterium]|nr:lipid A export permease/ATP-binding protein MsbA [Cellvibrionales bacterium]